MRRPKRWDYRWSQDDAAACAVEMIHAYSLVHDDLPAMDDDDLRRGRPTCHRQYDEATAILAGDSLQVLAFQCSRIRARRPPPPSACDIMDRSRASGTAGMAGGQALDLAAEGGSLTLAELEELHALKTGALIRASVLWRPIARRRWMPRPFRRWTPSASCVGLAFQIPDDILDVEGRHRRSSASRRQRRGTRQAHLSGHCGARPPRGPGAPNCTARPVANSAPHGWQRSPLAALSDWLLTRNR